MFCGLGWLLVVVLPPLSTRRLQGSLRASTSLCGHSFLRPTPIVATKSCVLGYHASLTLMARRLRQLPIVGSPSHFMGDHDEALRMAT